MIAVNFNGAPAFLLDDQMNWDKPFSVEATLPGIYERGLSGRETRRPTADTLRLNCKFTSHLVSFGAITNLRNSLQALNQQPVLCPFWPAGFAAGSAPIVTAAFYALFNDDGGFNSVQPAAALPFALTAYPLMVGIMPTIPDPEAQSGTVSQVDWEFADNGNYPLTFPALVAPNGLNTPAGLRPLFPFIPDWSTLPKSGTTEVDITRKQIGALRTLATAYYAQRGRRKVTQFFTLNGDDPLSMLRFFSDMGGEQNNFWLGVALNEANLAANLGAADNAMTVDNGAALGTNSCILLSDGINRVPLVVNNVAGNIWNLAGPPGTAFAAGNTRIESLVLARFDLVKLKMDFASPLVATAQIGFKELPWETNAVAGEVYGTTMGALPLTATFFHFSQTTPDETIDWYFTGFERDLSDGINEWLSAPMEFDNINETADLKRNQTTINSRNFADNPLSLLFPFSLEFPLMVEIFEGDVNSALDTVGNLRCYFYGEVVDADLEPPFITAQCKTLSHIFDRQIPRRQYQPTDNWALFEAANGLLPANWQWNAKAIGYNPNTLTLTVNNLGSTNPAPIVPHWFSYGYCIVTYADGTKAIRGIADNDWNGGGARPCNLVLTSGLPKAPEYGDTVKIFAGYDGQASTAQQKFNCYQHGFGGFPFIPTGNPTVLRITQPTGGMGKK